MQQCCWHCGVIVAMKCKFTVVEALQRAVADSGYRTMTLLQAMIQTVCLIPKVTIRNLILKTNSTTWRWMSTTLKLTKRMRVKVGINTTSWICLLLVLLSFSSENLQVRVASLEERCDELEQYSHCNMVRIRIDGDRERRHRRSRKASCSTMAWRENRRQRRGPFPSCGKEGGGPIDTPWHHRSVYDAQDPLQTEAYFQSRESPFWFNFYTVVDHCN